MPITNLQMDHAVAALVEILSFAHPADAVLSRFFREHPKLGSRDRGFIAETAFAILRHMRLLEHLAGSRAPRPLILTYLARIEGMNLRQLEPLLKARERDWFGQMKACSAKDLPLGVQADFPDWLVEKLRATMSDAEILELGRAMQAAAPLDLRVNTLSATRDDVLAQLVRDGFEAAPTPYSPIGIRLGGKPAVNRHALFTAGRIEVQDEGSQLLGFLLAPTRHDMVVDFCAGAGGKTLMLGAMMHSQGRLYAFDVSDKRLAKLKPRLARSGLSNVHPQVIAHERDPRIKRLAGKIDRVLVDAPCSGLGTLRRNPDLKWRQTPEGVAELTAKQASILESAATLVKKGGRVVYATCSILPEENEAIVEAFLAAHADFRLLDCAGILKQQHVGLDTGNCLRLSPARHGTDGFFAAVLKRAPSA
jgi:16S rRNA (cytosine967-C5)-methyltransferase